MPLTRDFKETIRARAQWDAKFRQGLLYEALECFINGEFAIGKLPRLGDLSFRCEAHATAGLQSIALQLRIPLKAISDSGGKPITIPERNRSGVGAKRRWLFDVAKTDRNRQAESVRSEAKAGGRNQRKGRGERDAVLCPASAHRGTERDQRSVWPDELRHGQIPAIRRESETGKRRLSFRRAQSINPPEEDCSAICRRRGV